jgi:hypothetical protein
MRQMIQHDYFILKIMAFLSKNNFLIKKDFCNLLFKILYFL